MKQTKLKKRRLSLQPLESRRVLAASLGWDGPGLGHSDLTYYVANSPSSLTQTQTDAAIETALAAWSSAADITFTKVSTPGLKDSIDISFTNIDGPGRTLAQAYLPDDVNAAKIAGDVQFDSSEIWEIGNSLGNQAFDLVYVAVHELGHSLGLDHTDAIGSVLQAFVSPSQSFTTLASVDVAAIQGLYAVAGSTSTTTTGTTTGSTTTTTQPPVDTTPTDTTNTGDTDDHPFPQNRWRRGGDWHRFGGRLETDTPENYNLYNPTDVNGDNSTTASDALIIINQLNRLASGDDSAVEGLCDTNGDGSITAGDALAVINVLNLSNVSLASVTTIGTADPVGDTTTVTDTADPVVDTTTVNDTTDETTTDPIDDGGLTDTDDDTEHGCGGGPVGHDEHHGSTFDGLPAIGLLGRNADQLISRFDTSGDGRLSQDEVPSKLWDYFVAQDVDTDGDALVTLSEIQTAITAAQAAKFAEQDTNSDGLLSEDEVSARVWSKLSVADTDGDVGVSLTELQTWLAANDNPSVKTNRPPMHQEHHGLDAAFAQLGRGLGNLSQLSRAGLNFGHPIFGRH